MIILGIETSCDETGAAVVRLQTDAQNADVLSNCIATSLSLHAQTGGIIPEIAAREQMKYILPVIHQALQEANSATNTIPLIDAIAVTVGPGLIGSLLVGVETAKTLAYVWKKPIIPVNHLFGHIYANWIASEQDKKITFPALALIVSGGHTDLVLLREHGLLQWIGGTRDDAAGEAFDKIGRLLGLAYPAGPVIETLARSGDPKAFHFPRPLLHENTFDFSFSGLKTAVLRTVQTLDRENQQGIEKQTLANIARATQDAIIEVLVAKTLTAAEQFSVKAILLAGGVAANTALTKQFLQQIQQQNLPYQFFVPPKQFCTDNAAMIATAGFFTASEVPWDTVSANPELYFE